MGSEVSEKVAYNAFSFFIEDSDYLSIVISKEHTEQFSKNHTTIQSVLTFKLGSETYDPKLLSCTKWYQNITDENC